MRNSVLIAIAVLVTLVSGVKGEDIKVDFDGGALKAPVSLGERIAVIGLEGVPAPGELPVLRTWPDASVAQMDRAIASAAAGLRKAGHKSLAEGSIVLCSRGPTRRNTRSFTGKRISLTSFRDPACRRKPPTR